MTELKTLKDLFYLDGTPPTREQLKAEAVKWVKEAEEELDLTTDEKDAVINFIKHFFNLTEEGLK